MLKLSSVVMMFALLTACGNPPRETVQTELAPPAEITIKAIEANPEQLAQNANTPQDAIDPATVTTAAVATEAELEAQQTAAQANATDAATTNTTTEAAKTP